MSPKRTRRAPSVLQRLTAPFVLLGKLWRTLWSLLWGNNIAWLRFAPPGHFYSPLPDMPEVVRDRSGLFDGCPETLPGIDLGAARQLALLEEIRPLCQGFPAAWGEPGQAERYYFDNNFFSYGDGIVTFGMLSRFQPKRVIEVGSGYSSAALLDAREHLGRDDLGLTFIEPYPDRLHTVLEGTPSSGYQLIQKGVQEVPLSVFEALEAEDILFVDSSHVVKLGSDVKWMVENILPTLRPGVIVHFHDILWPFEYPWRWVSQGRAWNEAYFLRSFLAFNERFEILFFNSYLEKVHGERYAASLPVAVTPSSFPRTPENSSLWLRVRG